MLPAINQALAILVVTMVIVWPPGFLERESRWHPPSLA